MPLWMVRAGRHGEQENLALDKGSVVIGWDEVSDLSKVSSFKEMKDLYRSINPEASVQVIANNAAQLWAFKGRIQIGDLVALPLKTRSAVALGKVTSDYRYISNNPEGAKHCRPVKWIRDDTPRSDFCQDLLQSLGAAMTVCQISRHNAEDRIKTMLKGSPDPGPPLGPKLSEGGEGEGGNGGEPPLVLEEYAQDQIRSYIGANFKSHDLTRLVTAVLEAQGYKTEMSAPGPDAGVDIIAGKGPMGFEQPRLCVQVKSGATPVDVTILRELQGVMKNFGAEQGLLVSWSGFKASVYREARTLFFEIRLWDADKLVQALLSHYDQLSDELQAELPLKRLWVLVQEENT